jgi:hypothetical protein
MTADIDDDQIFDIRNYAKDYRYDVGQARQLALSQGYQYIAWNGSIQDADTHETIYYPPAGFWRPDTLPFIGWKSGYSYYGRSLWLLGDKTVLFAVIPLRSDSSSP